MLVLVNALNTTVLGTEVLVKSGIGAALLHI